MTQTNDAYQLELIQRAKYEIRLEDNFYEFVKEAWQHVDCDDFIPTYHIKVVSAHLQAVAEGKIKRLIINIPPGFAKSLLVSVLYPAWVWLTNPQHCFLTGANSTPLSTRDTVRSRDLIKSEWYQYIWAKAFAFSSDQNQKTYYTNDKKGHRVSFSTSSNFTGWRANTLLLDDPLSFNDKYSKLKRDKVNHMVGGGLMTRLKKQKEDSIVVMGQRLHYEDVTGFLSKTGDWEVLNLPLIFNEATKCKTSIFEDNRQEGELLWSECWDEEIVKSVQRSLGNVEFSAQYQQSPIELSGGIININWFKYHRVLPEFDRIVDSWDTAFGEKEENDYSVGLTFGITNNMYYLLNVYRKQVGMPELKRAMLDIHNTFCSNQILVEDKASGKSVQQELTFNTRLPIKLITPKGCKVTRAHAASPTVEAGKVSLPNESEWLFLFKEEISQFPAGSHDDQVDAFTQFVNHETKDVPIVPTIIVC